MPIDLSSIFCALFGFLIVIGIGIWVLIMVYKSGYVKGKIDGLRENLQHRQTGFDVIMPEKKSEGLSENDQR